MIAGAPRQDSDAGLFVRIGDTFGVQVDVENRSTGANTDIGCRAVEKRLDRGIRVLDEHRLCINVRGNHRELLIGDAVRLVRLFT